MDGKTIVVTGAASGIGKEVAQRLVERGALVWGVDRNPIPDEVNVKESLQADLSTPDAIVALVEQLPGSIDGFVNVAGVPSSMPWELQFRVNFLGTRMLTELAGPRLADDGSLVTVASGTGHRWREKIEYWEPLVASRDFGAGLDWLRANPHDGLHSYSESKQAIIIWSLQEACRWTGSGKRLNVVSPGPVATPMLPQFRSAVGDELIDSDIARGGREATATDIGPAILWLLSADSAWIHGVDLPVDGGFSASMFMRP